MANLSTLTDDFGSTLDTNKWTVSNPNSATVATNNGRLQIDHSWNFDYGGWPPPWSGVTSVNGFEFDSAYVRMYPIDTTVDEWGMVNQIFGVINTTNDEGIGWLYSTQGGSLQAKIWNDLSDEWQVDVGSLTYNATDHAWLRVRYASGTFYWDTAPDNGSGAPGTWTQQFSYSTTGTGVSFDNMSAFLGTAGARITLRAFHWHNDMTSSWVESPPQFDGVNSALSAGRTGTMAASESGSDGFSASGSTTGHRYWRIWITANTASQHLDISEVELRTAIGGPDVTGTGTASASAFNSGFEPSKAFDNNIDTTWYTPWLGVNNQYWLKYDFGAGNPKDIKEVALTCWHPNEMVKDFQIQYSDDDVNWTTLYSIWGETGWVADETRVYNADKGVAPDYGAAKQTWRIRSFSVNGSSVLGLSELEMFLTVGGANQCTGGTAMASSQQESQGPPAEAFDGIKADSALGSYWSGRTTQEWLAYKFTSAKDIKQIAITARHTHSTQAPNDFVLEYWDGVSAWVPALYVYDEASWTSGETRTFTVNDIQLVELAISDTFSASGFVEDILPIAQLSDTFNGASLDPNKWVFTNAAESTGFPTSGTHDLSGGKLRLYGGTLSFDGDAFVDSVEYYSLIGSEFVVRVELNNSSDRIEYGVRIRAEVNPNTNFIAMVNSENTFYNSVRDNGSFEHVDTSPAYNATNHAWWRIRESGGTLYWDAAPDDGTGKPGTWTNISTYAVSNISWPLNKVKPRLVRSIMNTNTASSTDGMAMFDAVNTYAGTAGAMAATETGNDTFSSTAQLIVTGVLAATETAAADTFSSNGDVFVTGSLAATETGQDTVQIVVVTAILGAMDATETVHDTFSSDGDVVVSGSAALVEAGLDTIAISGVVPVTGSWTSFETGHDAFAATGSAPVTGSLTATEPVADTFTATGNVPRSGSFDATETGVDTWTATDGKVLINGDMPAVEPAVADTFTGVGGVRVTGLMLLVPEVGQDTMTGTGVVLVTGAMSTTEPSDTMLVTGTVRITGDFAALENSGFNDDFDATGTSFVTGNVVAVETTHDAFHAQGAPHNDGDLLATETGDDTINVIGTVHVRGALVATETPDTFSGAGVVPVQGSAPLAEAGLDIAQITGTAPRTGSLIASETGQDTLAMNGTLIVIGNADMVEGTDTFAAQGVLRVTGRLAATEAIDTMAAAGAVLVRGVMSASEPPVDDIFIVGQVQINGSMDVPEQAIPDTWTPTTGKVIVTATVALVESGPDTFEATGTRELPASLNGKESLVPDTFTGVGQVQVIGILDAGETFAFDVFNGSGQVPRTGVVSAVEGGGDAYSGAGTVLVSGSMAASEAHDSFTGTGVVVLQGPMSAVESGQDTALIVGKVIVQGPMTLVEAGPDTLSGTGVLLVRGSMNAADDLQDTMAVAGSVLVRGALLAVEGANDQFQSTGTAPRYGVVEAVEVGEDGIAIVARLIVTGTANLVEPPSVRDTFAAAGDVTDPTVGFANLEEEGLDSFASDGRVFWLIPPDRVLVVPPQGQLQMTVFEPVQNTTTVVSPAPDTVYELPESDKVIVPPTNDRMIVT